MMHEHSDYFSDDEKGMTFYPSSEQVMDKNMESPADPKSETDKKSLMNEENDDPKISFSEAVVPDIICQFKEKSAKKAHHLLPK